MVMKCFLSEHELDRSFLDDPRVRLAEENLAARVSSYNKVGIFVRSGMGGVYKYSVDRGNRE